MAFSAFQGPSASEWAGVACEGAVLMPSKRYRCDFSPQYHLRKKPPDGGGRGRNGRFSGKCCDPGQRLCHLFLLKYQVFRTCKHLPL